MASKRITQTVTNEALDIYEAMTDKMTGLSAALLAFKYLDIPGDIYKALIMGDTAALEKMSAAGELKAVVKSSSTGKRGRPKKEIDYVEEKSPSISTAQTTTPNTKTSQPISVEKKETPIVQEIVEPKIQATTQENELDNDLMSELSALESSSIVIEDEDEFVDFDPLSQF